MAQQAKHARATASSGFLATVLLKAIRIGVLGLVCFSPWAFGGGDPVFEFIELAWLAVLVSLWGLRMLAERRVIWVKCPVTTGLILLFLIGVWQITPLSRSALMAISPPTARLYQKFLPSTHETLVGNEALPAAPDAGSTISIYPGSTRKQLIRLLAVVLLFSLVRNNFSEEHGLRQLSLAALANGALLSFFGLAQHFSSPDHYLVYWTYPIRGAVFGPFLYRNIFSFYICLCFGLGLGLLFSSRHENSRFGEKNGSMTDLLQEPGKLWIAAALILMLAALIYCRARGGVLTFLGASILFAIAKFRQSRSPARIGAMLLIFLGSLTLAAWAGSDALRERYATIWTGKILKDVRLDTWTRAVGLIEEYPVWGTGLGTYPYVERTRHVDYRERVYFRIWEHAHNEYLEILVQGGIVSLLVCLGVLVLLFRAGWRAATSRRIPGMSDLALGAIFALVTVVLQCLTDLAIHFPAYTILTAVLCAALYTAGAARTENMGRPKAPEATADASWFSRSLAPVVGLVVAFGLGGILVGEGWKNYRVQRLWLAGLGLAADSGEATSERRIAALRAALELDPYSARLHEKIAELHLAAYEEQLGQDPKPAPRSEHLQAALRHYLIARDLCPILPRPQVRLAANCDFLKAKDPRRAYLDRAKALTAYDPDLWFLCGVQENLDGDPAEARKSWRHSLELSDKYLPEIVEFLKKGQVNVELLDEVLPDQPQVIRDAMDLLFPPGADTEMRNRYLDRALEMLQRAGADGNPADLHLEGRILLERGRIEEGLAAYQKALQLKADEWVWRLELAQALYQNGKFSEAKREVKTVLGRERENKQALELLALLNKTLKD